jgi:hypothetical protein
VNVDPDGLGPAGSGTLVLVTETHIDGFDFIPAQLDRSVDTEPGLAWDRTGGFHNGRMCLVYTLEQPGESNNTDTYVRFYDRCAPLRGSKTLAIVGGTVASRCEISPQPHR